MSEQSATVVAAIIGVLGSVLIAAVTALVTWMFAIVRRIDKLEERVTGLGKQLREVPKRSTDWKKG